MCRHFYEHEAEGADQLGITLPFPFTHCDLQRELRRTDTNLNITVIGYEVGNRHGEQSAAAVLVGIRHSTNSVGLPTTASGGLSTICIEPSDE